MDLAMDMEVMVDTVLDSMARERLSLATMAIMVTREAMDTEPEDTTTARGKLMPKPATMDTTVTRGDTDTGPGDTTTARGKLMLSLATMDTTATRGDTDTGPGATTTARGKPSPDMAIVMDTRDIPMAMVTVSTMDKKAES